MPERSDEYLASVLDCFPMAAAITDAGGRILAANSAARDTLAKQDGMEISEGRLRFTCRSAEEVLAPLTQSAGVACDEVLVLHRVDRVSTHGAWLLKVTPLTSEQSDPSERLVSWLDTRQPLPLDTRLLQDLFGLSRSEAKVVTSLVNHCQLSVVADELGIRQDTARAHLKSAFRKMGVHRQQQVIRTVTLLSLFQ